MVSAAASAPPVVDVVGRALVTARTLTDELAQAGNGWRESWRNAPRMSRMHAALEQAAQGFDDLGEQTAARGARSAATAARELGTMERYVRLYGAHQDPEDVQALLSRSGTITATASDTMAMWNQRRGAGDVRRAYASHLDEQLHDLGSALARRRAADADGTFHLAMDAHARNRVAQGALNFLDDFDPMRESSNVRAIDSIGRGTGSELATVDKDVVNAARTMGGDGSSASYERVPGAWGTWVNTDAVSVDALRTRLDLDAARVRSAYRPEAEAQQVRIMGGKVRSTDSILDGVETDVETITNSRAKILAGLELLNERPIVDGDLFDPALEKFDGDGMLAAARDLSSAHANLKERTAAMKQTLEALGIHGEAGGA